MNRIVKVTTKQIIFKTGNLAICSLYQFVVSAEPGLFGSEIRLPN